MSRYYTSIMVQNRTESKKEANKSFERIYPKELPQAKWMRTIGEEESSGQSEQKNNVQKYLTPLEWEKSAEIQKCRQRYGKGAREKARELTSTLNRYKNYGKAVLNSLKEVQQDTKMLDVDRPFSASGNRYQPKQTDRLAAAYKNLKWIYDQSPQLVETLAEQHHSGTSPSKRWMDLSRTEVKTVLELLEKEKGNPNFCPLAYLCPPEEKKKLENLATILRPPSANNITQMQSFTESNAPSLEKKEQKAVKVKPPRPLKPYHLMPLHIPGPDSLHQNVVIRPFSAEMDGRPEFDKKTGQNVMKLRKKSNSSPGFTDKHGNTTSGPTNTARDETSEEEEQGFTIESFIPFYSVTRT